MGRHPRSSQEQQERLLAYLTDDGTADVEKGAIVLALLAHAGLYLVLTAAETTWIAVTAVRVWQRRDAGLRGAIQGGVHKPALAVFLAADLGYALLRRAGTAQLSRRAAVRP